MDSNKKTIISSITSSAVVGVAVIGVMLGSNHQLVKKIDDLSTKINSLSELTNTSNDIITGKLDTISTNMITKEEMANLKNQIIDKITSVNDNLTKRLSNNFTQLSNLVKENGYTTIDGKITELKAVLNDIAGLVEGGDATSLNDLSNKLDSLDVIVSALPNSTESDEIKDAVAGVKNDTLQLVSAQNIGILNNLYNEFRDVTENISSYTSVNKATSLEILNLKSALSSLENRIISSLNKIVNEENPDLNEIMNLMLTKCNNLNETNFFTNVDSDYENDDNTNIKTIKTHLLNIKNALIEKNEAIFGD